MLQEKLKVLWVARYDYQPGWVLNGHKHNYFQIIYIIAGRGDFFIDNEKRQINPGQVYFIQPGVFHGLKADKNKVIKTLDTKFEVNDLALNDRLKTIKVCGKETDIVNYLEKIREEGIEKKDLFEEFSSLYLYNIILMILREQMPEKKDLEETERHVAPANNPVCNEFITFIRENYSKDIKLKDIAESMGYTESYICHCFKKAGMESPMHQLYQYRIKKAEELILYSDYSLKQIASMTGFKTVHHFNRIFKKYNSLTPGEYRNKERKGIRKDIYLSEEFINQKFTDK